MKRIYLFAAAAITLCACNDQGHPETAPVTDTAKTTNIDAPSTSAPSETSMPPDSAAMMKAWQAYMTPGPEHKMLAMSNGTWTEETKMYMSPDAPPDVMTGTVTNTMSMNGLYQTSVHKGSYHGQPFEGHNTLGYNNAAKKFQSAWIDNMGSGVMFLEGTYDSTTKTLTMTGNETDPMTGKMMQIRETWKMLDDKTQHMEMFDTHDGKEMKTMEVHITKK